jgi:hypothetical protein
MVVGAGLAAVWAVVGWWLGRRFETDAAERHRIAARAQESRA